MAAKVRPCVVVSVANPDRKAGLADWPNPG